MLSGLLNSDIAIEVNVNIMRAFVVMRNLLTTAKDEDKISELLDRIGVLEEVSEETMRVLNEFSEDNRKELDDIYIALSELSSRHKQLTKPRNPIGYVKGPHQPPLKGGF